MNYFPSTAHAGLAPWYAVQQPYSALLDGGSGIAYDPEMVPLTYDPMDMAPGYGAPPMGGGVLGYPARGSRFGAGATGLQLASLMPAPRGVVTNPRPAYGLQGIANSGRTFLGISGRDLVAAGIGAALIYGVPKLFGGSRW